MNSVLVIFSVNLFAISHRFMLRVFVQGRLNEVEVTIRISQMSVISMHSRYSEINNWATH